jgi:hypothetical protein
LTDIKEPPTTAFLLRTNFVLRPLVKGISLAIGAGCILPQMMSYTLTTIIYAATGFLLAGVVPVE